VPAEDRQWVGQRYAQLLRTVEMVEVEHGVLHRNGELRWLYSRAVVCHKTRDGMPDQILVVGQDITTRKRLEQLMQSQVMEMHELPERLRKFRERLGMTQSEFGREFAGTHGPYNARQMSSYETGETIVPLELLLAIRARGFVLEGVLGTGSSSVVEKTVSYFTTKRAEQTVIVQLLGVLLHLAERDRETIESALTELQIPGRLLTKSEEKVLAEVAGIVTIGERKK
jgi:transcriptional regulator with XRE-family HTH domain